MTSVNSVLFPLATAAVVLIALIVSCEADAPLEPGEELRRHYDTAPEYQYQRFPYRKKSKWVSGLTEAVVRRTSEETKRKEGKERERKGRKSVSAFLQPLSHPPTHFQARQVKQALRRCESDCKAKLGMRESAARRGRNEVDAALKVEEYDLELTHCTRTCISPSCYEKMYAADPVSPLEEVKGLLNALNPLTRHLKTLKSLVKTHLLMVVS